MLAAWVAVIVLLLVSFGFFLDFALEAVRFRFGVDYTEGEIWRQANAIPGKSMYGDINVYPYIAFEYPPLFYLVANGVTHVAGPFLQAGRMISLESTLLSGLMIAWLAHRGAGFGRSRAAANVAAAVAGLTPFALVPVIAFATLVHVDMLGLMFSLAGLTLAVQALRRPALLYFAVLAFVAGVFTKQTCIAAPLAVLAVWLLHDARQAVRAYAVGAALGLACMLWLGWQTHGGIVRHIFTYNINAWRWHNFLVLTGNVVQTCGIVIDLALVSLVLQWGLMARRLQLRGPLDAWRRLRSNEELAFFALMTGYLVFSCGTATLAGKNGASVNYYVEALYACCIWLGFLVAEHMRGVASARDRPWWQLFALTLCLPALVIVQVYRMPASFVANKDILYGKAVERDDDALLAVVRGMDKPVLSDDLALVLLAGKQAPIEPFIFAELSAAGLWDENRLVKMVQRQEFGAVITFRDPGDATFDVRFRPDTAAAILKYYPRVVAVGETRLRLVR